MQEKGSFGVIGPGAEVLLFRMTGARVALTGDVDEAQKALETFIEEGVVMILVSDDLYPHLQETAGRYRDSFLPVIAVLPGSGGETRNSDWILQNSVRKAIGFDVTEMIDR